MTTQAQGIIERLQRLHSLIRYRVERVADARQPRTQELSLSLILSDLDAAIDDIRGMLAEPVKCSTCDGTGWVPSAFFPDGRGCGKRGGAGTELRERGLITEARDGE